MLTTLLDAVRAAYAADATLDAQVVLRDVAQAWNDAELAVSLVRDPRWEARVAAIEALRILSAPDAIARACIVVLAMQDETDPRVREAIVAAFVDLKHEVGDALTSAFVSRFADDEPNVRRVVAGVLGGNREESAIDVLVRMTSDADADVRDWACFGLGHQLGSPRSDEGIVDTDAIREALARRLDDENEEVREEAATGLALRGDARGLERMTTMLEHWEEEGISQRVLATAAEAPDSQWVSALEAIVVERPEVRDAVRALEACRAKKPRPFCGVPRHAGCDCFRAI